MAPSQYECTRCGGAHALSHCPWPLVAAYEPAMPAAVVNLAGHNVEALAVDGRTPVTPAPFPSKLAAQTYLAVLARVPHLEYRVYPALLTKRTQHPT